MDNHAPYDAVIAMFAERYHVTPWAFEEGCTARWWHTLIELESSKQAAQKGRRK